MELEEKNRKQKKATSTDDMVLYANAIVVVEKRPQKRPLLLLLLSLRLNVVLPFLAKVSFPLVLHCTALFQTSLGYLLSNFKPAMMYHHNFLQGKWFLQF